MLFFSFGGGRGRKGGGGVNKVYYGLCGIGEFSIFFSEDFASRSPIGPWRFNVLFLFSNINYFKTMPKESS